MAVKVNIRNKLIEEIIHFSRNFPLATLGGMIVLIFNFHSIFAPQVAPYDPNKMNLMKRNGNPRSKFLLGTDFSGRDILSRIIYGARISLFISLLAVILGAVIGIFLGIIAGWYKRLEVRLCD